MVEKNKSVKSVLSAPTPKNIGKEKINPKQVEGRNKGKMR